MSGIYTRFNTTINNIDFKMVRKNDKCWIKIEPINQVSNPSSLHIILNGEHHHWDVYDESGREVHNIYFKGYKIVPSFYLKSGENCFRIEFGYNKIHILPITEIHEVSAYVEEKCCFISPQSSCWATAIYYTKRPDEPPFDEM